MNYCDGLAANSIRSMGASNESVGAPSISVTLREWRGGKDVVGSARERLELREQQCSYATSQRTMDAWPRTISR